MSTQQLEFMQCSTEETLLDLQMQFLPHMETTASSIDYTRSDKPIFTRIDDQERHFYAGENAEVVGVLQVSEAIRLRISTIPATMIKPHKTRPIQLDLGYRYTDGGHLQPMPLDDHNSLQVIMAPHKKSSRQKYTPKRLLDGGYSLEPADRQDGVHSLSQNNIARLSHEMIRIARTELVEFGSRT